jgi:hypothetical protein
MNRELARKVADAVLYEGYMLYPYRRSAVKNQQRWTFGILYPPQCPEVKTGTERSTMHSECLLEVLEDSAAVEIELRLLQILWQLPAANADGGAGPGATVVVRPCATETAPEIIERSVEFRVPLGTDVRVLAFSFPAARSTERSSHSRSYELQGSIVLSGEKVDDSAVKLRIDVKNETSLPSDASDRDSVLLRSLLSAHTLLAAEGAQFVSLLDPPAHLRDAVTACRNVGNFPVLVGNLGERDMILCSPIMLYDYPQIAPESGGDFYDATEIDEMLMLRVMTLSDAEKDEMRMADPRTRALLERTERSFREQSAKTHGTFREVPTARPAEGKPTGRI